MIGQGLDDTNVTLLLHNVMTAAGTDVFEVTQLVVNSSFLDADKVIELLATIPKMHLSPVKSIVELIEALSDGRGSLHELTQKRNDLPRVMADRRRRGGRDTIIVRRSAFAAAGAAAGGVDITLSSTFDTEESQLDQKKKAYHIPREGGARANRSFASTRSRSKGRGDGRRSGS